MCLPLYYIHSYGIEHRNFKPENILITLNDENSDLKILNFDLSKIIPTYLMKKQKNHIILYNMLLLKIY